MSADQEKQDAFKNALNSFTTYWVFVALHPSPFLVLYHAPWHYEWGGDKEGGHCRQRCRVQKAEQREAQHKGNTASTFTHTIPPHPVPVAGIT